MTTTVTPTPATSTSRRPTPASTTTPMPTTDARRSTPSRPSHHQCGTHTGLVSSHNDNNEEQLLGKLDDDCRMTPGVIATVFTSFLLQHN
ncbi:hypothetical protein EAG_02371 [Camponotus floridanus]|uniref:Uncharacterized protein n=1 Tax=Camponotus floridanus TaxID=104421 RepID=E2ASL2_CAMFO|nr:hypothetical protein EAG_02371 [Camponotus floridanus]